MAVYSMLFVLSLYFLHVFLDCGASRPRYLPFCSRKCSSSSSASNEVPRYQCSCSRSCAVFGDCCYDSPYRHTTSPPELKFVCVSVAGLGKYQAVASCPLGRNFDACKENLGYLPPVTSTVTNITYGNVFCASCNQDSGDVTRWNVELRCPSENGRDAEDTSKGSFRIEYRLGDFWKIYENDGSRRLCKFHVHFENFKLLDGLELRTCNSPSRISKCSGTWEKRDVMEECRSYEDPVYFGNVAFRNSHCAWCTYHNLADLDCLSSNVKYLFETNQINGSVVDFCRRRGSEECTRDLSALNKGKGYSISKMLKIHVVECIPPEGRKCCAGERFDYSTKQCRPFVRF